MTSSYGSSLGSVHGAAGLVLALAPADALGIPFEAMARREEQVTRAKFVNPLLTSAAAAASTRLVVVAPGGERHVFDGDVFRVGSHPSNELVIDDATVSRFHCRITRDGRSWRVTDCGSRNGTRLEGVSVLEAKIERESTLVLGDSTVRVTPGESGRVKVEGPSSFGAIVGQCAPMQRLFAILERVAPSDIDVLIHGESGTGKELVATELVQRSPRASGAVVVVDCGAISPALVESELFGHVRGAFTGADREREGAFEAASGGTLFLDEVGELPLELQPKLLRVLEAREVRRVGQNRARRVDVRVLCATNRDLEREVNRGRFREDLYYRLAKVTVRVPPLRDRLDDVPLLVRAFLGSASAGKLLSEAVLAGMQEHDWPGNVRELRNYVERSLVLDDVPPPQKSGTMRAYTKDEPPPEVAFRAAKEAAVNEFERAFVTALLARCEGNVSRAAREAKMDRMYLHQLAQKYGVRR